MTAEPVAAPASSVRRRITIDSIWILFGYAVTSGSGFLFWIVAARMIEPARLGIDTAVYSILTAAAAIAASGVGDGLLVMLPVSGAARARLLRLGVVIDVVVAAVAGTLAGVVALSVVGSRLPVPVTIAGIALATVVWSLFAIKDPVLQALGRADRASVLNGSGNVAKLALLVALGLVGAAASIDIVLPAILLPVVVTTAIAAIRTVPRSLKTEEGDAAAATVWMRDHRRAFSVFVARDGAANALYVGLALALPFLVTALAGPTQGALFALCFQLVLVLDLVALAVGASFSTHSAGTAQAAGSALRVWVRVLGIVTLGAIVLCALSPVILTLMRPFYVQHGGVLVIVVLAVASVLRSSYELWGASLRSQHRSVALLVANAGQAVALVAICVVAIPRFGALGAAGALLAVTIVMSIVGFVGMWRARTASLPDPTRVTPSPEGAR